MSKYKYEYILVDIFVKNKYKYIQIQFLDKYEYNYIWVYPKWANMNRNTDIWTVIREYQYKDEYLSHTTPKISML